MWNPGPRASIFPPTVRGYVDMLKAIFFSFLIFLPLLGGAGGADAGGADSVSLKKFRQLLDLAESDDIVYVNMKLGNYDSDVSYAYSSVMVDAVSRLVYSEKLFDNNMLFANLVALAMNSAGMSYFAKKMEESGTPVEPLLWTFVDKELPEINDEGIIRVENPQTKKQLAVQIGRHVFVYKPDFDELDNLSKAALLTHEAFLYAVKILHPQYIQKNGTEKIRTLNRRFVQFLKGLDKSWGYLTGDSTYPSEGVKEAFKQLNIPKN
jgi:hypothetical protein